MKALARAAAWEGAPPPAASLVEPMLAGLLPSALCLGEGRVGAGKSAAALFPRGLKKGCRPRPARRALPGDGDGGPGGAELGGGGWGGWVPPPLVASGAGRARHMAGWARQAPQYGRAAGNATGQAEPLNRAGHVALALKDHAGGAAGGAGAGAAYYFEQGNPRASVGRRVFRPALGGLYPGAAGQRKGHWLLKPTAPPARELAFRERFGERARVAWGGACKLDGHRVLGQLVRLNQVGKKKPPTPSAALPCFSL